MQPHCSSQVIESASRWLSDSGSPPLNLEKWDKPGKPGETKTCLRNLMPLGNRPFVIWRECLMPPAGTALYR